MEWAADTAAAAAGLAAAGGLLVPTLIARLPEPAPPADRDGEPGAGPDGGPESVGDPGREADREELGPVREPEPPKELYVSIAAMPGLAWRCAVVAGLAGALVGGRLGWVAALVFVVPLVPVVVALSVVDWRTKLLPTRVVVPATLVAIALVVVDALVQGTYDDLTRALVGMLLARSFYWVLWWLHSAGMGFGDVRLAALLGITLAYVGWSELVVGMYTGFLIFGLPGLVLALLRRDRAFLKTAYPFGPFMAVGSLVGICFGGAILAGLVSG